MGVCQCDVSAGCTGVSAGYWLRRYTAEAFKLPRGWRWSRPRAARRRSTGPLTVGDVDRILRRTGSSTGSTTAVAGTQHAKAVRRHSGTPGGSPSGAASRLRAVEYTGDSNRRLCGCSAVVGRGWLAVDRAVCRRFRMRSASMQTCRHSRTATEPTRDLRDQRHARTGRRLRGPIRSSRIYAGWPGTRHRQFDNH